MNTSRAESFNIHHFFFVLLLSALPFAASCFAQSAETGANAAAERAQATPKNCRSAAEQKPPAEWHGTPLHVAVVERDLTKVKSLLKSGANPNEKDNFGNTPLIAAINPIISEPKEMPAQKKTDKSAVEKANRLQLDIIRALLDQGANADERGAGGTTALIQAALWGYSPEHAVKIFKLLIERKADINLQNETGSTALMAAAAGGSPEKIRFLLENKADASLTDCENQTARDIARKNNRLEAINLLQ